LLLSTLLPLRLRSHTHNNFPVLKASTNHLTTPATLSRVEVGFEVIDEGTLLHGN
ncbi:hypothetical protein CSUI_004183, partial [Cystoisospora suis]